MNKQFKIIVVSAVAPPETVVAGRVNYDICEYLSKKGYKVELISPFPSRPLGKFQINRNKMEEITQINENFTHVRIASYQCPQFNFFKRVYESFSFGMKAINYINKNIKDADLIYATPWPFIGQLVMVIFRNKTNTPLIMNVQDLYPESFFTKYKSKMLALFLKPFYFIDSFIAYKCSHLTVVSESMKMVYVNNRKLDASKVSVIENWQDEEVFLKNRKEKSQVLIEYNLSDVSEKFIYMYLGNIGPIAGLEHVIQEFSKIETTNACLVIAGSGTSKEGCIALSQRLSMKNVHFVDISTGIESVADLQSIADVLILPIHPEASSSSIPSKLIAYMFSGKPILTSAKLDSTTGSAISESRCGFLIDNYVSWSQKMTEICLVDPTELIKMGKNGFNFAYSRYSKRKGLEKIENLFINILKNN